MQDNILNTFSDMIIKGKELTLEQAVKRLKLDEDAVMDMGRILQEHKIIKVHYSITGETVFRPLSAKDGGPGGLMAAEAKYDVVPDVPSSEETLRVDEFVSFLRKNTMRKKGII